MARAFHRSTRTFRSVFHDERLRDRSRIVRVHGIIQEHGGQIEVESELEKGTAFHILLPLVRFAQGVVAA